MKVLLRRCRPSQTSKYYKSDFSTWMNTQNKYFCHGEENGRIECSKTFQTFLKFCCKIFKNKRFSDFLNVRDFQKFQNIFSFFEISRQKKNDEN